METKMLKRDENQGSLEICASNCIFAKLQKHTYTV